MAAWNSYRLVKEVWSFRGNCMAVRLPIRSFGNKLRMLDEHSLMSR